MLGGVICMGELLLGHSLARPDVEFFADFAEAPRARFADRLPRVHYGAKRLAARFPAAWLFHQLRDDARRAHAMTLLETSTVSVDSIAGELGYSDAAGFTRAFQRWTGATPGAYRQNCSGPRASR